MRDDITDKKGGGEEKIMEEQTNRRPENLCRVPILQVDQRDKIKCIINIFFPFLQRLAMSCIVYAIY